MRQSRRTTNSRGTVARAQELVLRQAPINPPGDNARRPEEDAPEDNFGQDHPISPSAKSPRFTSQRYVGRWHVADEPEDDQKNPGDSCRENKRKRLSV